MTAQSIGRPEAQSPAGPTAAEPYCDVMEMPAAWCAHCRKLPDPTAYGNWYRAKTAGKCTACGDDIEPDDRIRADGQRGYVCESCGIGHV